MWKLSILWPPFPLYSVLWNFYNGLRIRTHDLSNTSLLPETRDPAQDQDHKVLKRIDIGQLKTRTQSSKSTFDKASPSIRMMGSFDDKPFHWCALSSILMDYEHEPLLRWLEQWENISRTALTNFVNKKYQIES